MENYSDIINLPYEGKKGERLSMHKRAAQFAPFAALKGYDTAILETARKFAEKFERPTDS